MGGHLRLVELLMTLDGTPYGQLVVRFDCFNTTVTAEVLQDYEEQTGFLFGFVKPGRI